MRLAILVISVASLLSIPMILVSLEFIWVVLMINIKEMNLNNKQNIVGEILTSKLLETILWAVVRVDYQDYKLCSTFELKAGDHQMKFFGIFGQVIPISGKDILSQKVISLKMLDAECNSKFMG
jgi:hypothetical protein